MSVQANPFKRSTILIMFAIGFAAFVALLYGLGAGNQFTSGKNGQAHGASNSIVGYKALANLLEKTGSPVTYSRTQAGIEKPGLLILTPAVASQSADLDQVVQDRAYVGPTMIILPKWQVTQSQTLTLKKGWVVRTEPWDGEAVGPMLDDIADTKVTRSKEAKGIASSTVGGTVKTPDSPVTISGDFIRNIVRDPRSGDALVAYLDDGGVYAQLDGLDPSVITDEAEIDADFFPVVIVADADLMNNFGMADKQTAEHALALIEAAAAGTDGEIMFDLTFNGLGSPKNLLTLAFEPPFLSATICLIVASLAAAWMAFNRFGPPVRAQRSIDFGKTALVNNSAGFIRRMGRSYLAVDPYAERIRSEAALALAIPAYTPDREINARLDALGESGGNRFSALFHNLSHAQKPHEIAEGAAALHAWKKEKIG